jgi:hypothetical protein
MVHASDTTTTRKEIEKTQKAPLGEIRLDSESNRLCMFFLHPRADPLTYTELASVFALLSTSFLIF